MKVTRHTATAITLAITGLASQTAASAAPAASRPPGGRATGIPRVIATIKVTGPDWAAVNPLTGTVYVTSEGTGLVSVINGATRKVTARINAGFLATGIAVNPLTGTD